MEHERGKRKGWDGDNEGSAPPKPKISKDKERKCILCDNEAAPDGPLCVIRVNNAL